MLFLQFLLFFRSFLVEFLQFLFSSSLWRTPNGIGSFGSLETFVEYPLNSLFNWLIKKEGQSRYNSQP